jgi:hypothetical protein
MKSKKENRLILASVLISVFLVSLGLIYRTGLSSVPPASIAKASIDLGELKAEMIKTGVIDEVKFQAASSTLNLLWALGLSNRNEILEKGPMADVSYGGPGNFASTGGWTLAKGNAMEHYSMHRFIELTPEQQNLVKKVTKNIYRPCCGNPAYFPDCNHGMAMLGLMEFLASRGANESEMYSEALKYNSLWFPDTYENINVYLARKGIDPGSVPPERILSAEFSSASGYQAVVAALKPEQNNGASCGV